MGKVESNLGNPFQLLLFFPLLTVHSDAHRKTEHPHSFFRCPTIQEFLISGRSVGPAFHSGGNYCNYMLCAFAKLKCKVGRSHDITLRQGMH